MDITKQSLLKSWNITTNGVFNRTQRFYTIYINRNKIARIFGEPVEDIFIMEEEDF